MFLRKPVSHAVAWMLSASLLTLVPAFAGQKPKSWDPGINPADFVGDVNNPYFPLVRGRSMLYRSATRSGTETLRIDVQNQRKTILGVSTVVVIETAALNGQTI